MALASSLRSLIPLVVGLVVGGVGATMFLESMPGAKGSPEERAQALELALKKANNRLAALEAEDAPGLASPGGKKRARDPHGRLRSEQSIADGARGIVEDLREGRPVNPEDIFRASQPLIRDLAPLFDRMRLKQQREMVDSMASKLARNYPLTPEQQSALKGWFEQKAQEEAKRWSEMMGREGTRLEDMVRATHETRMDEGLETFMQGVLSPQKLAAFKTERLNERAGRVQQAADRKVERLNGIVALDEAQRDQVFGIMARGSREYEPAMVLEGSRGPIGATPGGDPKAAMLSVLTPDQRAAYEAERQRRREAAVKEMEAIGLTLPSTWDLLDDDDFR